MITFDQFKYLVNQILPSWQISFESENLRIRISHSTYSEFYTFEYLFTATISELVESLIECHSIVFESPLESKHCLHAHSEYFEEVINGEIIKVIICKDCKDIIFPKYIPGKVVPKVQEGSKPAVIGSLSIPSDFESKLSYSPESKGVLTLKNPPPVNQPFTVSYKVEKGEMYIQIPSGWVLAEEVQNLPEQLKKIQEVKKVKKEDVKPGQRKVKFDPIE